LDFSTLELQLRSGLAELQLPFELNQHQIDQLLQYLGLLEKWNRAYNLTAIDSLPEMVSLHLLDSLAIAPYLTGQRFIDVGTGAGLPGIPLAIALPQQDFTLLDTNGKRVRFLFQVKTTLGLANAHEIQARVETYQVGGLYDGVISRAFSTIETMVTSTRHLLTPEGRFYAMKGRFPEKELSTLPNPYNVIASNRLKVPGIDGERHLLQLGISQ
jgi:16S rRNA (guanine527-N7)-methyltransferase